jgi:transcriptional regulator GlxA family with amidase domain
MDRRNFMACAAGISFCRIPSTGSFAQDATAPLVICAGKLTRPAKGLITVAFAISRDTTWIDWVGPQAVFETWHLDAVTKKHTPRFKLFTVSEKKEAVDSLIPDHTFDSLPPVNIIVVPAQRGSPALLRWLRKVHESADVTMSVCMGARHLAKAGLLDGRQATTHHGAIDRFANEFPKVEWVRGVRFVEGEKLCTGGGLTAGIDLALRVVERYFDRATAQKVADHLEYQGNGWKI